jgi:hypothetical protein
MIEKKTMRPSVQIRTLIPPPLSMAKRLRISKARQKELRAMMDEARARMAAGKCASEPEKSEMGKKLQSATAAA